MTKIVTLQQKLLIWDRFDAQVFHIIYVRVKILWSVNWISIPPLWNSAYACAPFLPKTPVAPLFFHAAHSGYYSSSLHAFCKTQYSGTFRQCDGLPNNRTEPKESRCHFYYVASAQVAPCSNRRIIGFAFNTKFRQQIGTFMQRQFQDRKQPLIHDLLFLPIFTTESAVGKRLITHCCVSRLACSRLSGHIEPHSTRLQAWNQHNYDGHELS